MIMFYCQDIRSCLGSRHLPQEGDFSTVPSLQELVKMLGHDGVMVGPIDQEIGWDKGPAMVLLRNHEVWVTLEEEMRRAIMKWDKDEFLDTLETVMIKDKLNSIAKEDQYKKSLEQATVQLRELERAYSIAQAAKDNFATGMREDLESSRKRVADAEASLVEVRSRCEEETKALRLKVRRLEEPMPSDDVLNAMDAGEAFEAARAASVKKGEVKDYFLRLHVPKDWNYLQIHDLVQQEHPNSEFTLRGPKVVDIAGEKLLEYGVSIKMDISHLGTNAETRLATRIRKVVQDSGKAYPTRLTTIYGLDVKQEKQDETMAGGGSVVSPPPSTTTSNQRRGFLLCPRP